MNRRLIVLGTAAAFAAGAVLTGCGSKTVSQGSAPISVNPTTPAPSADPSGHKITKEPITKPVTVSNKERTLTVTAAVGGCKSAALVSHESTASVTLVVQVTDHRKMGQMCPDIEKLTPVSATLKAPLDQRKIFDGATGKQVAVRG